MVFSSALESSKLFDSTDTKMQSLYTKVGKNMLDEHYYRVLINTIHVLYILTYQCHPHIVFVITFIEQSKFVQR